MQTMQGKSKKAIAARTQMAKASGTDLKGYDAQLATTEMFYKAKDAVKFSKSPKLKKTMKYVAEFSLAHGLLGEAAKDAGFIGIETPSGVYGSKKNIKLRFDPSYMDMAAKGKL